MCGQQLLAIDCPDMYRRVLRDAATRAGRSVELEAIDHVLITHVHGDHMNGLEGVAFYKHFVQGKRLGLLTSPEAAAVLWDHRLRAPMESLWDGSAFRTMRFADYCDLAPLDWTGETAVGPFRIRVRRTRHHVPTTALLVEAAGRKLGYSADTAFDPGLISFLAEADLVIHETNLGPAHTPYTELAALPADLRRRMRLVHYPDFLDTSTLAITALEEGQVLAV